MIRYNFTDFRLFSSGQFEPKNMNEIEQDKVDTHVYAMIGNAQMAFVSQVCYDKVKLRGGRVSSILNNHDLYKLFRLIYAI